MTFVDPASIDPAVYFRAADIIDERGLWCADRLKQEASETCVHLAIREAATTDVLHAHSLFFMGWLGLQPSWDINVLFEWNDADFRTKEQVVKELRACGDELVAAEARWTE